MSKTKQIILGRWECAIFALGLQLLPDFLNHNSLGGLLLRGSSEQLPSNMIHSNCSRLSTDKERNLKAKI